MSLLRAITTNARRGQSRGVSIIELLIGLGVVLAIAAIVIPWTTGWLGSRELDNAEDGLTMQMMMARAAAREEGRPVELVAQSDDTGSRISARWMNGSDDAPARSTRRDGERARSALDASGDDAARIDASWADMPLPRGVRIALGLETKRTAATDAIPSIDEDDAIASAAARGQTIAIFLPDGTVFFAPTFMLRTDAGSLRAMKVDRATGVPQQIETAPAPSNEFEGDRPEFDSFEDESDVSSDEPSNDGSDGDERASNDRAPSDRATVSARLP
jgi:type II secretory pathway pseudopilin PulG